MKNKNNKNNFLKTILATASLLAISSASTAHGVASQWKWKINENKATIENAVAPMGATSEGANIGVVVPQDPELFHQDQNIYFNEVSEVLIKNNTKIGTIDANGKNGSVVIDGGSDGVTISSVVNTSGDKIINFNIKKNGILKLSKDVQGYSATQKQIKGGTYSGLKSVTSYGDGEGKLVIGNGVTASIKINNTEEGSKNVSLKEVYLEENSTLRLDRDTDSHAKLFQLDKNSKIYVGIEGTLSGIFNSTNANAQGQIEFLNAGALSGDIGLEQNYIQKVISSQGEIGIHSSKPLYVENFHVNQGFFVFDDEANIKGKLTSQSTNAKTHDFVFKGSAVVEGEVGTKEQFVKKLTLFGEKDKTVDFHKPIYANKIEVNHSGTIKTKNVIHGEVELNHDGNQFTDNDGSNDSTLLFYGSDEVPELTVGKITTGAEGSMGAVVVDASCKNIDVKFQSTIGDVNSNSALALLDFQNGFKGNVIFEDSAHITQLNFTETTQLFLYGGGNNTPKKYKIDNIKLDESKLPSIIVGGSGHPELTGGVANAEHVVLQTTGKDNGNKVNYKLHDLSFNHEDSSIELSENINLTVEYFGLNKANSGIIKCKGGNTITRNSEYRSLGFKTLIVENSKENPVVLQSAVKIETLSMYANSFLVIKKDIDFHNNNGNVYNTNGGGVIIFDNEKILQFNASIESNNRPLDTLEFKGNKGVVFLKPQIQVKNIVSNVQTKNAKIELFFIYNSDLSQMNFSNIADNNSSMLIQLPESNNQNNEIQNTRLSGELAKNGKPIEFRMHENCKISVDTNHSKGAVFLTSTKNKGRLELLKSSSIQRAGTTDMPLKEITFGMDKAEITGGTYADNIIISQRVTGVLGGVIEGNLHLRNQSSLNLLDNTTLNASFQSSIAPTQLQTNGNALIKNLPRSLEQSFYNISFLGKNDKNTNNLTDTIFQPHQDKVELQLSNGGRVHARNKITVSDVKIKLNKGVEFVSQINSFKNSCLTLGKYDLDLHAEHSNTFVGKNIINSSINANGNSIGKIVLHNYTAFRDSSLDIVIEQPKSFKVKDGKPIEFTLIDTSITGNNNSPLYNLDLNKVNISSITLQDDDQKNSNTKLLDRLSWKVLKNNNNTKLIVQAFDKSKEISSNIVTKHKLDKVSAKNFANNDNTQILDLLAEKSKDTKDVYAVERIMYNLQSTPDNVIRDILHHGDIVNVIENQIKNVVLSDGVEGHSSGVGDYQYGLWFNPVYHNSSTIDKIPSPKHSFNYTLGGWGLFAGIDAKVSDSLLLGVSAGATTKNVKYISQQYGSEIGISAYEMSIYGLKQKGSYSIQTIGNLTLQDVENSIFKESFNNKEDKVESNYKTMTISGELLFLTSNKIGDILYISPKAGVGYKLQGGVSYEERGSTSDQNLVVHKKPSHNISPVMGVSILTKPLDMLGMPISFEFYGNGHYELWTNTEEKTSKIQLQGGGDITSDAYNNDNKLKYVQGFNIAGHLDIIDWNLRYERAVSGRFIDNKWSIKLKVDL